LDLFSFLSYFYRTFDNKYGRQQRKGLQIRGLFGPGLQRGVDHGRFHFVADRLQLRANGPDQRADRAGLLQGIRT